VLDDTPEYSLVNWRIYGASAIGKGHIDGSIPCQDAFCHATGNGRLVAVVCDGAGSAARSEVGAKECANAMVTFLASLPGTPSAACDRDMIARAIEAARSTIQDRATELNLPPSHLACTVIGAVLHEEGGCLFHIGDGVGVIELENASSVVSLPENGEYSNETYFVTNDDWQAHLRVDMFSGGIRCLALMSDGTAPFAFNKSALHGPFMDPVRSYLSKVSELEGSEALQATLAGEGTWKITSDDKTLLVVLPPQEA
jgi:hypothetical protein